MIAAPRHILIIGTGSVGRRHANNFHSLGCHVSCMDPRPDRLEQAGRELSIKHQFSTLETALDHAGEFAGVAVCSPPKFHVEQTQAALNFGLPVLLEKPVSVDSATCRPLQAGRSQERQVLLGYTYRWWPPIQKLKRLLEENTIGPLRHARFIMSAHLADWHPWERYQDFFMASRELGGGALLDESHFIDLMLWFFGMPERVYARVEQISDLHIETDDVVDMVAIYPNRFRVTMHLDLFGRPHDKQIVVTGENGTLQCLFNPDLVRIGRTPDPVWDTETFAVERNHMFMAVAQEFLDMIEGRHVDLTCTITDGVKALEIVDACRKSQRTGTEVPLAVSP
jgi:predicted dehydrogenase